MTNFSVAFTPEAEIEALQAYFGTKFKRQVLVKILKSV